MDRKPNLCWERDGDQLVRRWGVLLREADAATRDAGRACDARVRGSSRRGSSSWSVLVTLERPMSTAFPDEVREVLDWLPEMVAFA